MHVPAHQNFTDRPYYRARGVGDSEPPQQSTLMSLSQKRWVQVVSSDTAKFAAGSMAGAGFVLCGTGVGAAAGVPLLIAAGALWLLSTVLSIAKLENKTPRAVLGQLLYASVLGVGAGITGAVGTSLIAGAALFSSFQTIVGLICGGLLALLHLRTDIKNYQQNTRAADIAALHPAEEAEAPFTDAEEARFEEEARFMMEFFRSLAEQRRQLMEGQGATGVQHPAQVGAIFTADTSRSAEIHTKLLELYKTDEGFEKTVTYNGEPIRLCMAANGCPAAYETPAESTTSWVAVKRSDAIYDLYHQSSIASICAQASSAGVRPRHPVVHDTELTPGMFIKGEALDNLLTPT